MKWLTDSKSRAPDGPPWRFESRKAYPCQPKVQTSARTSREAPGAAAMVAAATAHARRRARAARSPDEGSDDGSPAIRTLYPSRLGFPGSGRSFSGGSSIIPGAGGHPRSPHSQSGGETTDAQHDEDTDHDPRGP